MAFAFSSPPRRHCFTVTSARIELALLSGYAGLDVSGKLAASQIPAALALNKTTLATFDNTAPADGDLWFDGSALKFRIGGATKTVTLT